MARMATWSPGSAPLAGKTNRAARPSWNTVTVCPAMVSVPVREVCDALFDVTEYVTTPSPVPLAPERDS